MTLENIVGIEAEQRKSKNGKYLNTGKEQTVLKRRTTTLNANKTGF